MKTMMCLILLMVGCANYEYGDIQKAKNEYCSEENRATRALARVAVNTATDIGIKDLCKQIDEEIDKLLEEVEEETEEETEEEPESDSESDSESEPESEPDSLPA